MPLPSWLSRLLPVRRAGRRRFDAAVHNRLTHSWQAAERSINTELRGDLDALRRRARDLSKNAPLAKKYLQMVVANVAGPNGFSFQARAADGQKPDALANTAIEAAWADWSLARNCDVAGRLSFPDMTRAVIRAVARDGEALVRVREGAPNPYGYALQLLDIERLDTTLNREAAPGRPAIIMGVELDGDGRPLAYWLSNNAIGRDPSGKKLSRIPAAEIMHLFITDDPEQVRGIPWMHSAMLTVNDLKGYNQAAIVAARIGASKMGFFTNPEGDAGAISDGEDAAGVPFTEAAPGQFGMLPAGYDFKSFDPDYPHANYASFVKEHKRDVASGLGVAYNTLANDLEGVNFSSIRSGTLEERDNWMLIQRWLIGVFLDPVYEAWLKSSLLAGAVLMPNGSALPAAKRTKFMAHEFQGRRWQWVDPLKDMQALVLGIENGLTDPYTVCAQQGVDAEDVLDGIARFQAAARARGVVLGKPVPEPADPKADDPADPPQDDASKTLQLAMARSLLQDRQPSAPPQITVAPVINTPEVRNEISVAAPVINLPEMNPTFEAVIPPAQITVENRQGDIHIPPSAAPVVNNHITVQPADISEVAITSMPERVTTGDVVRDKNGNIKSSRQTERDA